MFKTPVEKEDADGKIFYDHTRIISNNGMKLDLSLSYDMKKNALDKILDSVRGKYKCYYSFDFETNEKGHKYVQSCYRCAYYTAYTWLSVALNCRSMKNRTKWHSSVVAANRHQIKTFTNGTSNEYNLRVGDKYYVFNDQFLILITGDGVRLANVPKVTSDVSLASLRFTIFGEKLFFCKNTMSTFFITTKGHNKSYIIDILSKCLMRLSKRSHFTIWSEGINYP